MTSKFLMSLLALSVAVVAAMPSAMACDKDKDHKDGHRAGSVNGAMVSCDKDKDKDHGDGHEHKGGHNFGAARGTGALLMACDKDKDKEHGGGHENHEDGHDEDHEGHEGHFAS